MATWNSDGSPTDIQDIHDNDASAGDTITVPAGSFTWSTGITLTKGIKLEGAGSGRVVARSGSSVTIGTGTQTFTLNAAGITEIVNGMTLTVERTGTIIVGGNATGTRGTMTGTVSSYSGTTLTMNITSTAGSGTQGAWIFITDATTTVTSTAGATQLVNVTESTTNSIEISGIRFIPTTTGETIGFTRNGTTGKPILVHDCYFEMLGTSTLQISTSRGVIWNCSFVSYPFSLAPLFAHLKAEAQADDGWTNASTMGDADDGTHNIYFEDCDFNAALNASDSDDNIRSVFRYCIFNNAGQGSHGADTSNYGVRHYEVYNCEFIYNGFADGQTMNLNWWFFLRGGTGVITDNVLPNISSTDYGDKLEINMTVMNLQRLAGPHPCWGAGVGGDQYPAPRQVGMGRVTGASTSDAFAYNGDSEPLYIWNNTGGYTVGTSDFGGSECASADSTASYVVAGRDYFHDGTAKPGYTKFTYPHPLTIEEEPEPEPEPEPAPEESADTDSEVSEFFNLAELGLTESLAVIGEEFIWQGNTYPCILDYQRHSLVTQKSLFSNARYPKWGELITVAGKERQVTRLNGAALVSSSSGGRMVEEPPFTDDPADPSLTIEYDIQIK